MAPKPTCLRKSLAVVTSAATDPKLTGPILLASYFYSRRLQSILPSWLSTTAFFKTFALLFSFGLLRRISAKLSQWGLNNYRPDATFVKSEELIIITGGTSGIGALTALEFAKEEVKVVVLDLFPPKEPLPSGVMFYKCDITSTSQVAEAAEQIRMNHGDPTVLVNNAGVAYCRTILDQTEVNIRRTFEVNTIAHYWMVREFLPAMIKKNHGHVVTVASMASFVVHAQNTDYACTKASSQAFHEGLSSELVSRFDAPDVKTTIIHPTWTHTPMTGALTANSKFTELILEPELVATSIAAQVMSGRSAFLFLPPAVSFLGTIRAWPSWAQQMVRKKIGPQLAFYGGSDVQMPED
ncbi:hypothetical protein BJ878DRAFT_195063 [Calycina marina]|uniref:Short-chain dehydrogenase/reductase 3 n=1 Tax=Calycina marina TaxID=1763456 RepID=A0A9P7Z8K4_9HELO|nr:hypothetical protein BJ878DRAFT_195063 [Calycina marina]